MGASGVASHLVRGFLSTPNHLPLKRRNGVFASPVNSAYRAWSVTTSPVPPSVRAGGHRRERSPGPSHGGLPVQPPLPSLPTLQRPLPLQDEAAAPELLPTRLGCLGDGCAGEPQGPKQRTGVGEEEDPGGKPPWILCPQTMLQEIFFCPKSAILASGNILN